MKSSFFISLLFVSASMLRAQTQTTHTGHDHAPAGIEAFKRQTVFDADSVKGFNEAAALQQAGYNQLPDWHKERFVAVMKRNYIDAKYKLKPAPPEPKPQGACTNVDFETGTVAGWTITEGDNINSTTMAMGAVIASTQAIAIGPGTDPYVPTLSTVPAGGGAYTCRLGDIFSGGKAYRMSQTINITAANAVFMYNYAIVLLDGSHQCFEQPYFNISFVDCNNNPIPCGQYYMAAPGLLCQNNTDPTFQSFASYKFKPWTAAAFDLSAYIGQCVKIEFTVAGCISTLGAHQGYAYIDCSCQPMSLIYNNNPIISGQTTAPFCLGSPSSNVLCAPAGFSYNWTGPGVTSQTTQCVSVSGPGSYSVSLTPPGASTLCFSPVLHANLVAVPSPTVNPALTQPVCASPLGSATLNIAGGTGPYTYSWTPATTTGSVLGGILPGTSYSVQVTDNVGCMGIGSFTINTFPGAPLFSVTPSPVNIGCANPSATLSLYPTDPATSTSWSGPGGAITGTSTVASAPGTYTYTALNTTSTCSLTSYIVVNSNTITPTGTYSLSCQSGTVFLEGNATFPAGSTASLSGPLGAIPNPAVVADGNTYTLSIVDPASGCQNSYIIPVVGIGPPTGSLSASANNTLTCITPTLPISVSYTPASAGITWAWAGGGSSTANPLSVSAAGTYTAILTNTLSGCSSILTVTVGANTTPPVLSLTSNTLIPCSTGTLNLGAGGADTYTWAPSGTTGSSLPVTTAGSYTVTGTNAANGCTNTLVIPVGTETVNAAFTATPTSGPAPLTVGFTNNSTGAIINTHWNYGQAIPAGSNAVTYNITGTYTVSLVVSNGVCYDSTTLLIYVYPLSFIEIPNVFTPNGDGTNDVFTLKAAFLDQVSISIYNRWGHKLYEETGTNNISWDGKNNGNLVADGTYFYMLKATGADQKTYDLQGTINVFH